MSEAANPKPAPRPPPKYDPKAIEPKWQQIWADTQLYAATDNDATRQKYYYLVEFPYPSGDGLHVGHVLSYTALDIMARHKRMQGYNVLYPMGFDEFGLPTENYAIKNKIAPQVATERNVANFRRQMRELGLSFDWSREVETADPNFYKWTQWIFLRLLEKGLAYQAELPINWCPFEKTGLANEEVVDGKHERCGTPVEKKLLKQWVLKITAYADRLAEDLKSVNYIERAAVQQVNWIGRSEGAEITFKLRDVPGQADDAHWVTVYTTRPDTLFGATFIVISPETAQFWLNIGWKAPQKVQDYIETSLKKTELSRQEDVKTKSGVDTGIKAVHPLTGELIPVWVADYVLGSYGTGAIMAVPAHDERDYDFAKAFGLPVVDVMKQSGDKLFTGYAPLINSGDFNGLEGTEAKRAIVKALFDIGAGKGATKYKLRDWIFSRQHYWGEPIPVVHCAQCAAKEAQPKISLSFYDQPTWDAILGGVKTVESRALNPDEPDRFFGHIKAGDVVELVNKPADTRLAIKILEARHFDSVEALNADHAWATSVSETGTKKALAKQIADFASYAPDYMDRIKANGLVAWRFQPLTKVVPLPESALPLELPVVESYEPTGTGESPLAAITDWVNTTCPDCGGPAKRETDTMPNWAGSSWYYLRYMDPHNPKAFASKQNLAYWGQVDHYNGGMEHTTLHLLYSRFWHKFLYDQGLVPTSEPYAKRTSHGVILGPDGQKMSKSRGNVINPDHVIEQYGADTIRLYEMFMGPFEEEKAWSEEHLAGVSRFIYRVWTLAQDLIAAHGDAPAPTGPSQENTGELALAVDRLTHKTLQKVHHDIESMSFNTMVSALMEYVNYLTRAKVKTQLLAPEAADLSRRTVRALVLMLAPSAPHLAEELWRQLGETSSVHAASWPKYDPAALKEDMVTIVVQVNGKVRANLLAPIEATNAELEELARADANVAKFLTGTIAKTIVVPRKLVNFVVK